MFPAPTPSKIYRRLQCLGSSVLLKSLLGFKDTSGGRDRGAPTGTDDDFYLYKWPTIRLLVH